MIKKIVSASIVTAAVFMLIGCGGGSGSTATATTTTTSPTTPTTQVTTTGNPIVTTPTMRTGTGYYVDAVIAGVSYQCGTSSGVTDDNGTFTFEFNIDDASDEVCTFSLNGLLLRSVRESDIGDGESVFEDVILIAQLLQTLDSDGNASNGITIIPEVMTYLSENGFTTLPSSPAEIEALFDDLNSSVPGYEGHFVTEVEAEEHLEETRQSLDQTAPVITLNGDALVIVAHGSSFTDPGVTVTDDYYAESEINVTVTGSVDTNVVGSHTLTYTAEDGAGNSSSTIRTVTVVDQTAPGLTVSNTDITIEVGSTFTEADALNGVSASDVVDGSVSVSADISSVNSAMLGDYTVNYTATDTANNSVTGTATVHVTDTTIPSIVLNGNDPDSVEVAQGSSYTDLGAVITDNSGETILAEVTGTVDTTSVGSYTLTYTGTDSTGNVNSVSRTVNVVDNTMPVITLKGNAAMTVAHGSSFADPGTTVVDNSGESLSASVSGSVDTNTVGTYILTYTVTDSSTNDATAVTRTVTVTDQTAPGITVSNTDITIEVGSTFTEADALNGVSASDVVDGSVSVSADITAVNNALIGDYTVTYTATDDAGNNVTATAAVHVRDTTVPSITLNGNDPDSVEVAQGSMYADLGVTITDNSGETITAIVTGTADTTQVGTYTLIYVARDSSGNDSNVSRTVNVVDTTAPVVTVTGANPMNILLNETYSEEGAVVTDNSGESLTASVESNNVDTSVMGEYTVVYLATDSSGIEGRASRVVQVTSGQPPVITVTGDETLVIEVNQTGIYTDQGATATDVEDTTVNVEIDATAVNIQAIGTYTVTFTATDSNGNRVQETRTVEVVDTTKPVITLSGDNPMSVNQNATFTDPGATVVDNSGETLSADVTGSVDTSTVGEYTLTYSATDSSGHAETVIRTVTVVDVTAPVITTGGNVTVEVHTSYVDTGTSALDAVDGDISVAVNSSTVNTSQLGDYTVTYTATDSANNTATATIVVHVVDTTSPEIIIDGDNPLNILVGDAYIEMGTIVTDNYDSGLSTTVISNDVNTSSVGLYQVVYHAVDTSGNEANATRVVNVTAGQPPVITLNGPNPYDVQLGTGYSDPGAGANDPEDGPVTVDINASEVDTNLLGTYTVYFEATDSQGNMAYAIRTVNVVENVNLTANPDSPEPQPASVDDMITLHVIDNDYVPSGANITDVFLKVWDPQQGVNNYLKSFQIEGQGWWTVIDQAIEFTPDSTFGGGMVYSEYQIVDSNGDTAESWVLIEYPEVLVARGDSNSSAQIEPYSIDVLENDIYTEVTEVTIDFITHDQNGQEISVPEVNNNEGNWTVSNGEVLFTPSPVFSGGTVWVDYRIQENGRISRAQASIEYPIYVQAMYDQVDMIDLLSVTYDVMGNDTLGAGVTGDVYVLDYNTQPVQQVKQMVDFMGEWIVEANQSITFNPGQNFTGGNAHVEYVLTDGNEHYSQTGFDIHYPVYLQANHDHIDGLTDIVMVNVNVLGNDELPEDNSTVTVKIQSGWDQQTGQPTYGTHYEDLRGVWQLEADRTVTFTPKDTFGGGTVWLQYQISDTEGHVSQSNIEIVYPLFVEANYDEMSANDAMQAVTFDVVGNNDRVGAGITPIVQLVQYSNGQPSGYTNSYTDHLGTWTVEANQSITFVPDSNFGGGDAHVEYVLTDGDDHYSQTGFTIHYPVSATPVCEVSSLNTVDDVYATFKTNLSFASNNGEREFEAELDSDDYVIDPALYGSSTAVSGLDPMYMVHYWEQTHTTQSGDTFVEVDMGSTEVALNSIDGTWYYDDQKSGNDRGYKYVDSEGESGTYVAETDGSNTLSITGEGEVFAFKVVRQITQSEINNILENAGINLTLDSDDTAQLNLSKELQSDYDWWGPVDDNSYDSLDAFIAANEYNSSATQFNNNGVLRTQTWQKVIIFAENSVGETSGTLIEIDRQTNEILTVDAGAWNTEEDDNGNTIIVAETTLCGYEDHIFKLDGTTILQGQKEEAGAVSAELAFSESLKDKLADYFITEAPLDIDPAHPNSPEITESMLSGKIFYTVREDQSSGITYYSRLTVNSPDQLTKEDFAVDANDDALPSTTETMNYELDDGRIRIQGNGDIKVGLNDDPAGGDWDVTIYTWDSMSQEIWLLNEPADFPQ